MTELEPKEEAQEAAGDPGAGEDTVDEVEMEALPDAEPDPEPEEEEIPPMKSKEAMAIVKQSPDVPDFNDIYQVGAQAVINSLSRHKEAKDAVTACSGNVAAAEAAVAAAQFEHSEAIKREQDAKAATVEAVQAQKLLLENYLAG